MISKRTFMVLWWLQFVISLGVLVGIGYVAIHFIRKYW